MKVCAKRRQDAINPSNNLTRTKSSSKKSRQPSNPPQKKTRFQPERKQRKNFSPDYFVENESFIVPFDTSVLRDWEWTVWIVGGFLET